MINNALRFALLCDANNPHDVREFFRYVAGDRELSGIFLMHNKGNDAASGKLYSAFNEYLMQTLTEEEQTALCVKHQAQLDHLQKLTF